MNYNDMLDALDETEIYFIQRYANAKTGSREERRFRRIVKTIQEARKYIMEHHQEDIK